eukprot:gnl/Dysnectes_brevis/1335_a1499_2323.p1 GENE.gnl/Dysnectes_brevis/1335_a1499_2323~~gnl/Dysnectes_brevis/1335_a1499_2323.p1  ORF type:complete len:202 (-),score=40.55 gnl/Dysnectes_brevis/1335_a1499_2323:236-841(-)
MPPRHSKSKGGDKHHVRSTTDNIKTSTHRNADLAELEQIELEQAALVEAQLQALGDETLDEELLAQIEKGKEEYLQQKTVAPQHDPLFDGAADAIDTHDPSAPLDVILSRYEDNDMLQSFIKLVDEPQNKTDSMRRHLVSAISQTALFILAARAHGQAGTGSDHPALERLTELVGLLGAYDEALLELAMLEEEEEEEEQEG